MLTVVYLNIFTVKSGSLIKDLVGDLLVMDNVCELLNQKPRTNKVLGWKHLGARLKIDKDTLDDLSPPKDDLKCPTEALIRHLGSRMTHLTVADFAWALYRIDRADALAVLEVYLPGRSLERKEGREGGRKEMNYFVSSIRNVKICCVFSRSEKFQSEIC